MKTLVCILVAVGVCASLGALLISQPQGIVSAAFGELKLESIPPEGGIVGAPPKFKVGKETLEFLQKLEKEQKVIQVQPDGSVQIQ